MGRQEETVRFRPAGGEAARHWPAELSGGRRSLDVGAAGAAPFGVGAVGFGGQRAVERVEAGIAARGHALVDAVQPFRLCEAADLVLRGEAFDGWGGERAEKRGVNLRRGGGAGGQPDGSSGD